MKELFSFRNWLILSTIAAFSLVAGGTAPAQSPAGKLRVGVYDSRAIALAYANSTEFQDSLKAVQADYQKAKAAKDEKRVKEIEGRMKLGQRRTHEQAFSVASVAGIMARVKDALPGVAKKAGVQALACKWELNYQSPEVELVDVTDQLVALFHVSDKGREWAKQVRAQTPAPLEQITDDMD